MTRELGAPRREALGLPPFRPLPPFLTAWTQTVGASFWPRSERPPSATHRVALPDGDQLVVVEDRPPGWRAGDRVVALVHGLCGSHRSAYMVRLAARLLERGLLALRINLRGAGPGFGLARHPYHSGRSEDTRAVVAWAARRFPGSPLTQIGFSLGGNMTLKMAGEDGRAPTGNLDSVAAVSPPVDLAASSVHMRRGRNRFFDRYFVRELRATVARHQERFPELPPVHFPARMTLVDFDEHFTAPRCGFRDAADYYARASARPVVPAIALPTLILGSADDPVIDTACYPEFPPRDGLDLVITPRGGHVGFLARHGHVHWMDELLLAWLNELAG